MAKLGEWAQTYCFEHEVVDECTVRAESAKWDKVEESMTERQSMGRTLTSCSICGKPAMQAVCTRIDCI